MIEYKEVSFEELLRSDDDFPSLKVIYPLGEIRYTHQGKYHREDGPAIIYSNDYKVYYYYQGQYYPDIPSDDYWIKFLKLKAFM